MQAFANRVRPRVESIPDFAICPSSPGFPTASDPDHLKRFNILQVIRIIRAHFAQLFTPKLLLWKYFVCNVHRLNLSSVESYQFSY